MKSVGIFGNFEEAKKYSKIHGIDLFVVPESEDAMCLVGYTQNKKQEVAAKKEKIKRKKMWVTIEDGTTCESCRSMNGKIVDEDDYFEFKNYKLSDPPLHWMTMTENGYKLIKNGSKDKITCRCGVFYFSEKIRGE